MKKIFIVIKSGVVAVSRFLLGWWRMVLALVVVGVLAWFVFDYIDTKKQLTLLESPVAVQEAQKEANEKEIQEVIAQVSKFIILPDGAPSLATIQDVGALAEQQPFFKDAQNGDQILIYTDKAIIFSPERNILVNVGPVYAQESEEVESEEIIPPVVEVYEEE